MTRQRLIEEYDKGLVNLDLKTWPSVNIDKLTEKQKEIFLRRKLAIELYVKNEQTVKEISQLTQVNTEEIRRLIKRCLQSDDLGSIWGYRALIPYKNIANYNRTKEIKYDNENSVNMVGAFEQLLDKYPNIKTKIETKYFNKEKGSVKEPNIRVKHLHNIFLKACKAEGIPPSDYPFITNDQGLRALYRYIRRLENEHFSEAAKRHGENVYHHALRTGIGEQNTPQIIRPFQRVQFDGHRIDAIFAIKFKTLEGDEIVDVMERIWILAIIDVATRVIIGYHLCLSKEYSSSDVLTCIRNAVIPWQPKTLTIPGLKYPEDGGFPSGMISETEWAKWDEFYLDNGKANLSNIVRDRLTRIVGCAVNAGPVNTPERRSIIERFFRTLEENGYQRLTNTTGSNSKDPRRNNPEKKAINYEITFEDLEELTEVLIATYNCTPHEGLNNYTPLDVLRQRIARKMDINQIPDDQRDEVAFFTLQTQRNVKGSIKSGVRPYILYENVRYRSQVLSRSPDLIGTTLDLYVNIEDIRVIRAFLPDGSEFGTLTASGKWGITPHSLQIRKQIYKLKNRKVIHFTSQDDPIEIFHQYLRSKAVHSKKARNQMKKLEKSLKQSEKQQNSQEVSNTVEENVSKVSDQFSNRQELRKTDKNQNDVLDAIIY